MVENRKEHFMYRIVLLVVVTVATELLKDKR